ncbi:hypothetical protein L6452_43639 [Arctium lappa]|uniref:Uncharacterized protein n=1 Tax=Arctium lappa TaxID=4217 RepID=A0ACB8XDG6_ARCLA|nr:hypothetical protein L6452_43639 [Arctium lappa]
MSHDMFGGGEFEDSVEDGSIPKDMNNLKDGVEHINKEKVQKEVEEEKEEKDREDGEEEKGENDGEDVKDVDEEEEAQKEGKEDKRGEHGDKQGEEVLDRGEEGKEKEEKEKKNFEGEMMDIEAAHLIVSFSDQNQNFVEEQNQVNESLDDAKNPILHKKKGRRRLTKRQIVMSQTQIRSKKMG